jgi:MoaA/NifB/PqqE/SkfB family radical SAM enzyme
MVFEGLERRVRNRPLPPRHREPPAVTEDKKALELALLRLVERALAEDRLGPAALRGLGQNLLRGILMKGGYSGPKKRFRSNHGASPPDFLVLSPGKTCNLKCVGCYASSGPVREKLDWATLSRVVDEGHDLFGMRMFVISGGEPLAYRDQGFGILDLAALHPDCYFMLYTNGTLITQAVAARMAALGNVMPALSVEGMRRRTDARRGDGVFDKVVEAMGRLRRHKVLFGLSFTATRENADEILSDEVVRFFFREQGALFGWVFHYMPIGRGFTLDLMMTPEQRLRLFDRVWDLVRDERIFLADFWNSATVTNGCVAGGRAGGYFYVNWDGWMSPCVFVPYSPANIKDVYASGGTIEDAWAHPFFAGIRGWQRDYGYRERGEAPPERCGNWMTPCIIRDHHSVFRELVKEHRPVPTDGEAWQAVADPTYRDGLVAYGNRLRQLTDPIWEERYVPSSCWRARRQDESASGGHGVEHGPMTRTPPRRGESGAVRDGATPHGS